MIPCYQAYCADIATDAVRALRASEIESVSGGARVHGRGGDEERRKAEIYARERWVGDFHFMGTSTFSEYTVVHEVAVAQVGNDEAPLD